MSDFRTCKICGSKSLPHEPHPESYCNKAELELMKKHAKEGWDLANTRTLELRTANLQIDELKRHWFTIRQAANSMEDILTATEKRIRPTPKCEAAAYVPGYPCPACKQTHD